MLGPLYGVIFQYKETLSKNLNDEKRLKCYSPSEMVPLSISTRLFYRYDMVQSASANHGLV